MMPPTRSLWGLSVLLFLAAEAAILLGVGWDSLPLVALWAAAFVGAFAAAAFFRRPLLRVMPVGLLLVACPVLTFEGGLFFIPAFAVLLVATLRAVRPTGRLLEGRR